MSRVIKFRAWDKKLKFIHDDVYIGNGGFIYTSASRTYDTPNTEIEQDDGNLIAMQFTGLQDKKGTDIYEGDIVVNEVAEEIYTVKFGAYGYTDTVGFHCVDSYDDPHSFYGGMGDVNYLTVIGNIHENPELLESSK